MFSFASAFNQPLNAWDVGQVTSMDSMFYSASAFNQPLSAWDVGQVTSMSSMFLSSGGALSDCNRLATHASFEAQIPWVWDYEWGALGCPPSPPAPPADPPAPPTPPAPPAPPAAPPPPPAPPTPPAPPPTPPAMPPGAFADKGALQDALREWCIDPVPAAAAYGHVSTWDVSTLTTMSGDYSGFVPDCAFNEDIDAWNVGQVTDMRYLFKDASSFNRSLG